MSEHKLTTADAFEVESIDKNGHDKTEEYAVNRWCKKDDRLYIDDDSKLDKHNIYVDLETATVANVPSRVWSTDVTVEGDTLTVEITRGKVREKTYTLVLTAEGGEFEDDDDDKAELVADGGEDVTNHIDDATIEGAIAQHDDPDHEDALTVGEVRDILATIQQSVETMWGEWVDNIQRGDSTVVTETADLIVLDAGERNPIRDELDAHSDLPDDRIARTVVTAIMHELARQHTDHNWGVTYPLVTRKPEDVGDGQAYVEAVINGLIDRGLSAGQAWAYYGCEIKGESQSAWARRQGRDQSQISKALKQARKELP